MALKFKGNGIVWNKDKNKPLCNFNNGDYQTDDKQEQKILTDLGFKSEEVKTEVPNLSELSQEELKKISNDDLKSYLNSQEIEYNSKATKDDLIALIVGDENGQE